MNEKKVTVSRRNILKTFSAGSGVVAAGSVLPEAWVKPIVNQVVLPAHAQTTDDSDASAGGVTTTAAPTTTQAAPTTLKFFVTSF